MCMGFVLNIDRKLYCMVQGLCLCSVLIYLSFMSVFWSARLTSIMKLRAVVDRSTYYSILNSFDQRSQYLSIKFLLPKQALLTKPRQPTVRNGMLLLQLKTQIV